MQVEIRHVAFEDDDTRGADLLVSSPPYGIGKSYEHAATVAAYAQWACGCVATLAARVRPGGVVCWQVGNHVEDGFVTPLDEIYLPLFRANGFRLLNRIVWSFRHGLHAQHRLSGRYEVLLCLVKESPGMAYTFNLDDVREPSKEPGKRSYKGPNKGSLSGHPLGKNPSDVWEIMQVEWDRGRMDVPPVKNNHVEKAAHPCQFPVELAERCVLLFSNAGDLVYDPFAGSGTTLVAAKFHDRRAVGCERDVQFHAVATERLARVEAGTFKHRAIGTPIVEASASVKTRVYPAEWRPQLDAHAKTPRLVETDTQRLAVSSGERE
jgi:adenine-specific DNA-methyltransferase